MKSITAGLAFLAVLECVICLSVTLQGAGVSERFKIWTIAQHLFQSDKKGTLTKVYPLITQLDEELEDTPIESLCEAVSYRLSELGEPDMASMMPLYCQWYPMGLPFTSNYDHSNSGTYFVLNGKRYDHSDDVFYLKSSELKKQAQVPDQAVIAVNDVVIGHNSEAPIVYFYGCPDDEESTFEEFNRNLYSEATETGKLRYIWRSTCHVERDTKLGPFPVELSLRDDKSDINVLPIECLGIPHQFDKSKYGLINPTAKKLSDLDLKVANLIAQKYNLSKDFNSTLDYARGIINNFPLLVPELITMKNNTEAIMKSNTNLTESGVDHKLLGLYINGENYRFSSLDQYTLLNALESEYRRLKQLLSGLMKMYSKSTLITAKDLITRFSQISIPNLQQSQPIKVDLHRIRGFSESVIYFNDIEIDNQYQELTQDINKFFEKSKFGEIPEYRHNWNELIFVIDFNKLEDQNTQLALEGLKRAIGVVTQGYPQRIGLLPLNTGDSDNIIRKIYELKDGDLLELEDFLGNELVSGSKITSDYADTPDVAKLLRNLQINETSIIINGEIYPFRKNTWHYLIAKTIKKDVGYLKRELKRYIKRDGDKVQPVIDVRGVLHLKSSETRHMKYTPDYFADSTYTTLDNSALQVWDERILEYVKGKEYNILHTITLVDDFNTLQALKRLHNLIGMKFVGVKFRLLHSGAFGSNWKILKKITSKPSFLQELKSLIKQSNRSSPINQLNPNVLQNWLPDLKPEFLSAKSFMLINGRFIHFEENEIPQIKLFETTIKREAQRTIDALEALETILPGITSNKIDPEFIETTSAVLTKMFYQGTELYGNGPVFTTESTLSRFDMTEILLVNNFTIFESISNEDKPIDLVLVIDPLEERSQRLLSLIKDVQYLPFLNVKIVIYPTTDLKFMPIDRIYVPNFPDEVSSKLDDIESKFDVTVEVPHNFVLNDHQNVRGYLVEVHAFDRKQPVSEGIIDGLGDVCLELVDGSGKSIDKTITMTTFGYGQFIVPELGSNFSICSCDPRYKVISFSSDARADYMPVKSINVTSLNPVVTYVKLEKVDEVAKIAVEDSIINIFTIPRNEHSFEQEYQKMVLHILNSPQGDYMGVRFWLLDQPFISHSLRKFIDAINLDTKLDGSIELVKYEWPPWLRPQRFLERRMDAYKVLFLDVLFPQSVSRIIYMDPSISQLPDPFKLNEKVRTKLPFAMYKMVGHGYWETRYWAQRLGDRNLKFHSVHPAFVINLQNLRAYYGGNKLRIHYQRLSADVLSLGKIDQDLINDAQEEVPIRTLSSSTIVFLNVKNQDSVDAWLKNFEEIAVNSETATTTSTSANPENAQENAKETQDFMHDEL
ncbi:hypothetical protein ZYGR_0AK01860 [Zygosaccharomyces rouxii]|uniref:PH domain-containing protein n=1 Tax=Zygosaccharomyces rouxii TaxID=4956 RepID=A0A1Q3AD34_ZYGRO|nr:hypothetical protein ZYGR_0AK01860 [Zygosaccharomyces rouxii]